MMAPLFDDCNDKMFVLYDFILSLWWHSVYLLYIVLIMMTLFCSLGPWGDEGVAERPPVWGVLYFVCTGRLRHAYHLPHDPSGTVQRTHPTVPLLTSPTPTPPNHFQMTPQVQFNIPTPLRSTFPPPLISHPIQQPLLHPSPTPTPPNYLKNYTSGTIRLSNPHPTPWWLAHHLLHDAIGNIQHSRLHPTACNYCIIWHVSHWLHVLTNTGICSVLIVWFDKPMFSSCISLSVWPLKNVRVNCFDCGIWSVLGEC